MLTFADITEPDVPQRACALAVDALQLIGADDNVGNCRTIVENEHSAVTASVGIGVAGAATIEFFVSVVNRAGNGRRRSERNDRPRASRNVESLGGGERHQRGEKSSGVLHVV